MGLRSLGGGVVRQVRGSSSTAPYASKATPRTQTRIARMAWSLSRISIMRRARTATYYHLDGRQETPSRLRQPTRYPKANVVGLHVFLTGIVCDGGAMEGSRAP